MIAYIFSLLPKSEYESFISANKRDILKMTIIALKKTITTHWKQFVKEDELLQDLYHRHHGTFEPHYRGAVPEAWWSIRQRHHLPSAMACL
jgi:hypothetical protein